MSLKQLVMMSILAVAPALVFAEPVIRDEGVAISEREFKSIVDTWTSAMRSSAGNDKGERLELINQVLMGKKIAHEADQLDEEDEGYWELQLALQSVKQKFMFRRHMDNLEMPDIAQLARERYDTRKDEYAKVPETRTSSHILLHCPSGTCDRKPLREKAAQLVAELRDGADFEDMVEEHSGDPGSKARGGKYDRWMRFGDPEVTPPYTEALFAIEEVGGYSEPVDSQFGVHIIRLDGIREGGYRPFKEVREKIASEIYNEYRNLAAKAYRSKYMISDDAFIDGEAMETIFAPYKSQD